MSRISISYSFKVDRTMAHLRNDDINFDKLETGVHNAMKADDLYWLQNDAKFRAVKQQGSYDDFK